MNFKVQAYGKENVDIGRGVQEFKLWRRNIVQIVFLCKRGETGRYIERAQALLLVELLFGLLSRCELLFIARRQHNGLDNHITLLVFLFWWVFEIQWNTRRAGSLLRFRLWTLKQISELSFLKLDHQTVEYLERSSELKIRKFLLFFLQFAKCIWTLLTRFRKNRQRWWGRVLKHICWRIILDEKTIQIVNDQIDYGNIVLSMSQVHNAWLTHEKWQYFQMKMKLLWLFRLKRYFLKKRNVLPRTKRHILFSLRNRRWLCGKWEGSLSERTSGTWYNRLRERTT